MQSLANYSTCTASAIATFHVFIYTYNACTYICMLLYILYLRTLHVLKRMQLLHRRLFTTLPQAHDISLLTTTDKLTHACLS